MGSQIEFVRPEPFFFLEWTEDGLTAWQQAHKQASKQAWLVKHPLLGKPQRARSVLVSTSGLVCDHDLRYLRSLSQLKCVLNLTTLDFSEMKTFNV